MTVFIQKGDEPLTRRQAEKRGKAILDLEMPPFEREAGAAMQDPSYVAWAEQWVVDNMTNEANNVFNWDLREYRRASARLEQYKLSEGRPELTEERETGEYDEDGAPILETFVIQSSIEPLPSQVEVTIMDEDTGEERTELVDNPEIVKDEEERAAAQAVIDAASVEVKEFHA